MRRIATDRPATEVEVVRDIMSGSLFLTGSRVCGCRRSRSPVALVAALRPWRSALGRLGVGSRSGC